MQTNLVLILNPHAIIAQYEREIVIKNVKCMFIRGLKASVIIRETIGGEI